MPIGDFLYFQWEKDSKMKKFAKLMLRLIPSEKGTTSIEYALVASLIFLAIVASVIQLAGGVTSMYQLVASSVVR
jgi:Flp pilus assembly pilin Flp